MVGSDHDKAFNYRLKRYIPAMKIKGRIMGKTWKILFPTLLILSLMLVAVVHVNAQDYRYINAEILPSQGGAGTTIILRFTTTNVSVGDVTPADIFWDNNTIAINQPGVLGANGAYNYNLTIPTEPPLSNIGNHTIRLDSNVVPYGAVSFSFTFNVTEFVPSPEYLALNETYYAVLTNYTDILGNYTQLLSSYEELSSNYTTLMAQHNNDTLNYNTLISQYNVLNTNYNSLTASYNQLATLSSGYSSLQANFLSLNASYSNLAQNYRELNSSYVGLLANYNSLTGQLDFNRNLNYILIIATIALAITTVYLAMIKPKRQTRIR